jgi:arylsulfatase A-like enzyme
LAGGGTAAGHAVGRTDAHAAEVTDEPVSPGDVVATLLALIGLDPAGELRDRHDRPFTACDGRPIERLLRG